MTERPNLLIIMVDQMQALLLDEGAPVALPALSRLADASTQFTAAFTPAPICTPARASFQLGMPVHRHGVLGNDRAMPGGWPTLADRLNSAGYATSYVGKWHLDKGNSRGWQRFVDDGSLRVADAGTHVMRDAFAPHEGVAPYGVQQHVDGRIAQRSIEELALLQRATSPYALMVSFHGPHAPYYLPADWHDHVDPDAIALPDTFNAPFDDKPQIQRRFRCRAWGVQWSEAKWRRISAAYFGCCAMISHLIGEILSHVDLGRTAVLFVSDHGENNGHHRMIYKGPMMYEQLVRIPALLHLPNQSSRPSDARLVDLTDFTATLLQLARADADGVEGHDVMDAAWHGRDAIVSEFHEANWVTPVCTQRVAMLRQRRWKYVYNEGDRPELYDLAECPIEVTNRADDPACKERAAHMHAELVRRVPWLQ